MTHLTREAPREPLITPADTRNYRVQPCCENCRHSHIGYNDWDGDDYCILRAKVIPSTDPDYEEYGECEDVDPAYVYAYKDYESTFVKNCNTLKEAYEYCCEMNRNYRSDKESGLNVPHYQNRIFTDQRFAETIRRCGICDLYEPEGE